MFRDSFIMSWKNIAANKMRSFLTILGIMIGISAIIALITIVSGVTDSILSQVSDMGANKITLSVQGNEIKKGLAASDIDNILLLEQVAGVSPQLPFTADIYYNGESEQQVSIIGCDASAFINDKDLAAEGRSIMPVDCIQNTQVCLLSKSLADSLIPSGGFYSQKVWIDGFEYTVAGILDSSKVTGNTAYIPYTTAMHLYNLPNVTQMDIYLTNGSLAGQVGLQISAIIANAYNGNEVSYTISNMQGILDTVTSITGMMGMMLGGIASIALLVGGIGIMNMMLVSVTERTAEIGLRKALGASPKRIRQQFLLESICLCLFGGILGLLLGVGLAFTICLAIGSPFRLSFTAICVALVFSVAVGIIFGYTPAKRASKMNPIEALRLR